MNKANVLAALSKLSTQVTLDKVGEHLVSIEKIEKGLAEPDCGEFKPHEEVEQWAKSWHK